VINIRNVQMSVRSYQNLYGYDPGTTPYAENGTQSIAVHLFDKGYINQILSSALTGDRPCPGGGDYEIQNEATFPAVGSLYVSCSLETAQQHGVPNTAMW
jgi:hypothetical protein